jgi:hypothetical protein
MVYLAALEIGRLHIILCAMISHDDFPWQAAAFSVAETLSGGCDSNHSLRSGTCRDMRHK